MTTAYYMSIFVHFAVNLYHRRYAVLDGAYVTV